MERKTKKVCIVSFPVFFRVIDVFKTASRGSSTAEFSLESVSGLQYFCIVMFFIHNTTVSFK